MALRVRPPIIRPPEAYLQKCIWIASYPKSGNTWVRVFIHNLLRELAGESEGAQDINRLGRHTLWELGAKTFERELGKPIREASGVEIAQARFRVQAKIAQDQRGPFFMKTHNAIANVEGYPTINLAITLSAIVAVRNPLDVAISYAHHSATTVDAVIAHMANPSLASLTTETVVYEFMASWSFNVASWLSVPTRPIYLIRYEDMLQKPEPTFAALASFLHLKPTKQQLSRAIEKSSFKVLAQQEQRSGFIERPVNMTTFFREGKAGQWRDVLTRKQIDGIVSAHAPMMQRCGYLPPDCGCDVLLANSKEMRS